MFRQGKTERSYRKFLSAALLSLLCLCSAFGVSAAKENPRICPKDKLIMIRESFIGDTISKYSVYDCLGNYLGSMLNGNYIQKNVDVVDDNIISVVCAEEATYVYLLKEHMKCLKLDPAYNYVRPEGELLSATEYHEDKEKMYILDRTGKEIFSLPHSEMAAGYTSTSLKKVIYRDKEKAKPYYFAGSTNWEGFSELYLIDEAGTILQEYDDPDFIQGGLFNDSVYLDGNWYICGWEECKIFDTYGHQIGNCSIEDYNRMVGKEDEADPYYYPSEGEEAIIGKSKNGVLIRGLHNDEVYQRVERNDGIVLEESTGYEESYILKNKYYICNRTEYGEDEEGYHEPVYNARICDYDGNVLKEYKNSRLGDWPKEKYMTLEHGRYRGVIDMDGNWVLKQICTDGTD